MQNYRKLNVWLNSMDIAIELYKIVDEFQVKDQIAIGTQIKKSAVSIPSNIAEGTSRRSSRDFSRFLEIAQGSAFELETQLEIAKRCDLIDTEIAEKYLFQLAGLKAGIYKLNESVLRKMNSLGVLTICVMTAALITILLKSPA